MLVAHVGPSGIGHYGWYSRFLDGNDHRLDGQQGEVGRWPVRSNLCVDRLVTVVVGDPPVIDVDGDALRTDGELTACLPDTDDHIRIPLQDCSPDDVG